MRYIAFVTCLNKMTRCCSTRYSSAILPIKLYGAACSSMSQPESMRISDSELYAYDVLLSAQSSSSSGNSWSPSLHYCHNIKQLSIPM